jgi:hypothetical protein
MQRVLCKQEWTTAAMTDYCQCGHIYPALQDLLLPRRGFETINGETYAWMANTVVAALREARDIPPKYATADKNVTGVFQEFTLATNIETQAVALAQVRGKVNVIIYGGPANEVQSHFLVWDNRNRTVLQELKRSYPTVLEKDEYDIILAGDFTEEQQLQLKKRHTCNTGRIKDMIALLQRINHLYPEGHFSEESMATLERTNTRIP